MVDKIPMVVWFILATVAVSLTDLFYNDSASRPAINMRLIGNTIIAALMLIFTVRTWSACSRPLLLAASIYLMSVCAIQLNLIGVGQITEKTALFYFINWGAIIVFLLGVVDYYTNKCGKDDKKQF